MERSLLNYNNNVLEEPIIVVSNDLQEEDNLEQLKKLEKILKSKKKKIICPYCKKEGETNTMEFFSIFTLLFYLLGCCFVFLIIQLIRGKEVNCTNTTHFCKHCENRLYAYNSSC